MQDFPSYLPIYSLISHSGSKVRRFYDMVVSGLIAGGVRVATVYADLDDGAGDPRCFRSALSLRPEGRDEYWYQGTEQDLTVRLAGLARNVDLVLVEATCHMGLPQIILDEEPAAAVSDAIRLYGFAQDPENAARIIIHHLQRKLGMRPVWACILIGGRSSRMGRPKHLLPDDTGQTWLERTVRTVQPHVAGVVLSGRGEVPADLHSLTRLPDIPDVAGPLTGILSAMRWQPDVSWLLLACDMPEVTAQAIEWLLAEKKPGQWGSVPAIAGGKGVEPLFARYEPQCAALFEQMCSAGIRRISNIADFKRVQVVRVPDHLHVAWQNINTPAELSRFIS